MKLHQSLESKATEFMPVLKNRAYSLAGRNAYPARSGSFTATPGRSNALTCS